ncbi:DUF418 domain-containing protein [Pendulispora rubella]|uniref:DUF418 domain-containing protein n=1 Tax=Pendulispora rubella TaxID=2741070 RepID=A0ABZ2L5U5_9BACT
MSTRTAGPGPRIEEIDVIRGMALYGVLIINLVYAFRVPDFTPAVSEPRRLEHVVASFLAVVVTEKAMTLFSVLFGVGLSIFRERSGMLLLPRRIVVLLAFGVLHTFGLWDGDVLTTYALSGFLALMFLRGRPWMLVAVAVTLLAVHPLISLYCPRWLATPRPEPADYSDQVLATYGRGTYGEIFVFRAHDVLARFKVLLIVAVPRALGNMLVGVAIWKSGILARVPNHRRALRWMAIGGIAVGAGYSLHDEVAAALAGTPSPWNLLRRVVWSFTVVPQALGYGAALLLALQHPRARPWLLRLAPLGRMAFTNYLTQTIVLSTLFYGYGFGLMGRLGVSEGVLLGTVLFVIQGYVSSYWLRHFKYGPFEWIWRCLTYGRWQAIRL